MRIFGDLEVSIDYNYENVINAWTIGVCNTQFTERVVRSLFPVRISLMYDKDRSKYIESGTYAEDNGDEYSFTGYVFGEYSIFIYSAEKMSFIRNGQEQVYKLVNEIVNTNNRELQYEMSQ